MYVIAEDSVPSHGSSRTNTSTTSYDFPLANYQDISHAGHQDLEVSVIGDADPSLQILGQYDNHEVYTHHMPDFANKWNVPELETYTVQQSLEQIHSELDLVTYQQSNKSTMSCDGYEDSSTAPSTPMLVPCSVSMRSSVSSTAQEYQSYAFASDFNTFDKFVKMEDNSDWVLDPILMNTSVNFVPPQHERIATFSTKMVLPSKQLEASSWASESSFIQYSSESSPNETSMSTLPSLSVHHSRKSRLNSVVRTKAPRKMTTREEANFICNFNGCGKLFGRSYNFKAHQETHSPNREYSFPCQVAQCTKKFVRRTDLQRHHASVHTKSKNFPCEFCQRQFARKDTLRRHVEDGCAKRHAVDIGLSRFSVSSTD